METSIRTEPTTGPMEHDDIDADTDTDTTPDRGVARAEARIAAFAGAEHARVVAAVSVWCGSVDDATDAVADALGAAWEQFEAGGTVNNLAAWVTTAAMNTVRARHRHNAVRRRKAHMAAVVDRRDDTTDQSAAKVDLRRALDTLTARQRDVIALFYGLDLPVADIATQLRVAPGTVKATLHQARMALANQLSDEV